ncbi:MAG: hypothetical protein J6B71_07160 [Clostridia bacterium]|nr:hypothetical protein [Clostridia bacterium]
MKKLLSILLVTVMLLSMLVACQGGDDGKGTTPPKPQTTTAPKQEQTPEGVLELIKDGTVNYTIVYNRNQDEAYTLATRLRNEIKEYLGANIYIRMDTEYDPDETTLEILLGNTNRPESQEALAQTPRLKDYFVGVIGNKYVVAGNNEAMIEKALNFFLSKYVYVNKKGTENGSLIVDAEDNHLGLGSYTLNSLKIAGEDLSKYSIVYAEKGTSGEAFVAYVLQNYFYEKAGLIVPTHDDTVPATDFEILIGDTSRSDPTVGKSKYGAYVDGKKLQLISDGYFGYLDLATYVTTTMFAGKKDVEFKADYSVFESIKSANILKDRTGDFRVMFHNVWMHENVKFGADNGRYEAAVVLGYRPDVVGFNEFVAGWDTTDLVKQLNEAGYVKVEYGDGRISAPIYYNSNTVKLIAAERYPYGSLNTSGGFAAQNADGKWYNKNDNRWSGANFAVFESLTTGEQFGVLNTHLESNTYVPTQQPDEGDPIRAEQVTDVVIPATMEMVQKYNVPIVMGGDFNSVATRIACTLLVDAGFDNARDNAGVKNDYCSCHGYPAYNEVLGSYVGNALPKTNSGYRNSIDQIYTYDASDVLRENTYRTIGDTIIGYISDHCPVILDFSITEPLEEGATK